MTKALLNGKLACTHPFTGAAVPPTEQALSVKTVTVHSLAHIPLPPPNYRRILRLTRATGTNTQHLVTDNWGIRA